ncbi:MAG: carboxypeptidase-like regulatory domain-containing protein [Pseudomonadota bacterium]
MKLLSQFASFYRTGGGIAALGSAVLLSGCGGGGSSAPVAVTPPVTVASKPMSGTVASGAPMLGATVTVKDANGVTRSAIAAADGTYSGVSTEGTTGPYSVQGCGVVDANYTCLYSVVQQAGVANVTPLTNATVALALGGDPAAMFSPTAPVAPPSAAALEVQSQKLKVALADVLAKAGVSNIDFATTAFTADRSGIDKVLDSIKISTGIDGGSNKSFVQMESIIGSGNVFLDQATAAAGTIKASSAPDVDLSGITTLFVQGMSTAIGAADRATCVSRMAAANLFDDSFTLDFDDQTLVTKATAPAKICEFVDMGGLLGGAVANPVLRDCDFTTDTNQKICMVGFNIVRGENSFDGAELAVVLRPNMGWKLLGRESVYDIHIGAAVQRTSRADLPPGSIADLAYTRALSFDITGTDGVSATGVRAAKVYQRSLDGSAWETTPLVTLTLTDACIAAVQPDERARLAIVSTNNDGNNGGCGSSWLSLGDSGMGQSADAAAAAGDLLIDNFYKRGRKVKVELYADVAASGTPVVLYKRVEGMPPKFAALAGFPWMEMDAATKTAMAAYDGSASTFVVGWVPNRVISGKDVSVCLIGGCDGKDRGAQADIINGRSSQSVTIENKPTSAAGFKFVGLYGRNSDQLGVSTNYISCGGAASCFQR